MNNLDEKLKDLETLNILASIENALEDTVIAFFENRSNEEIRNYAKMLEDACTYVIEGYASSFLEGKED